MHAKLASPPESREPERDQPSCTGFSRQDLRTPALPSVTLRRSRALGVARPLSASSLPRRGEETTAPGCQGAQSPRETTRQTSHHGERQQKRGWVGRVGEPAPDSQGGQGGLHTGAGGDRSLPHGAGCELRTHARHPAWEPRNLWDNPVEQEGQGRAMEGCVCSFSWGDKDTQSTYGTPPPPPLLSASNWPLIAPTPIAGLRRSRSR